MALTKAVILASLLALCQGTAIKWTGIVNDQQWTTVNNWYPAQVPGPNDDVTIDDAEGSDAIVVLNAQASIGSLTMGSLVRNNAHFRVLGQLTVNRYINVGGQGILEMDSGAAGIACASIDCSGEFTFAAGTLVGTARVTGFANLAGQAAKVFESAQVTVSSKTNVQASGSLQFRNSSTFSSSTGVIAAGAMFQTVVMDTSTGNSFNAKGIQWGN